MSQALHDMSKNLSCRLSIAMNLALFIVFSDVELIPVLVFYSNRCAGVYSARDDWIMV